MIKYSVDTEMRLEYIEHLTDEMRIAIQEVRWAIRDGHRTDRDLGILKDIVEDFRKSIAEQWEFYDKL